MTRLYRLADAAAVAYALLGLLVLLVGAFSVSLGPWPIRISGADRLLFIAAALAAIRHVAHPADPLHRRLARFARAPRESAGAAARVAVVSRIAVLAAGYAGVMTIGVAPGTISSPRRRIRPESSRALRRWVVRHHRARRVFVRGRFDRQQNVAFFPAFPLLERVVGYAFGAFAERRLGGAVCACCGQAW